MDRLGLCCGWIIISGRFHTCTAANIRAYTLQKVMKVELPAALAEENK